MRPSPAGSGTFAVSTASLPSPAACSTSSASASAGTSGMSPIATSVTPSDVQRGQRDAHGVAGAARRVLHDEREVGRCQRLLHGVGAPWPMTTVIACGDKRACSVQHVRDHRPPGERMQDLRDARSACACPARRQARRHESGRSRRDGVLFDPANDTPGVQIGRRPIVYGVLARASLTASSSRMAAPSAR